MELLVTIAVIAILVGLLIPAAAMARDSARRARELAAGQQLITAFALYAQDHRGTLMPGYATSAMTDPATSEDQSLQVHDDRGERFYGVPARRYPWRLAPYMDYNFAGLYKDERVLSRYRERADFQYVVSLSPSYGLNSMFVGGDADRFGFNAAATAQWGTFYITRDDQARRPSDLLVFASSHGVNPDGAEPVPGYFRVDAPYRTGRQWTTNPGEVRGNPASTGNVDFRFGGKAGPPGGTGGQPGAAACVMTDGHCATLTFEQLGDMRRWANGATEAGWVVQAR